MSKRSITPVILAVAIAAVAICVICVICVVTLVPWRQYLPFLMPEQAAPQLMPADSFFFSSVKPNIQSLAGYKHLADVYGDTSEVDNALDDISREIEGESGISIEDDIMPWLGPEVAVAVTGLDMVTEGEAPVLIIAAATTDVKASNAFLEKLRGYLEEQGYDVEEETYSDVTYYVQAVEYEWDTSLIFGTVEKSVLLTTDEGAMRDVIDVAQGKAGALAENERYRELRKALPDSAVAYTFFDMEDVVEAIMENLESEGVYLPDETFDQLAALQALGSALSLKEEGIQLDAAVAFDPTVLSPEMLQDLGGKASAHRILKQIPDDVLGFISAQNLAVGWRSLMSSMQQNPDFRYQLQDLEGELGLRIDEELLSWLTGEFAVAVVEGREEDVPVGGFAVFEVDQREEAEDVLTDLAGVIEELALMEFVRRDINDVEMQILMDLYTEETSLGYGFTGQHLIIGLTEDALEAAVDGGRQSVADDETFKKVQRHLPSKTGGYFYVNVEAAWRLAYRDMRDWEQQDFDRTVRPFLEPIKAIGMVVSPLDTEKGVGQSTLFIYIPGD